MSHDTRPQPTPPPGSLDAHTQAAVVPMASWLLLPFSSFLWPAPPPPGYSSCRGSGSDGGGDSGYWRPTIVAAFAGAQVGRALRRRFAGLLHSPEVRHLDALTKMGSFWFEGSESFATFHILAAIGNVFSAPYVCSSTLFSGNGAYVAHVASQGKLLMWGAKLTSYLLDVVIMMQFNCFSLNSIGPMVEMLSGPRRYLAVYFSSVLAMAVAYYFHGLILDEGNTSLARGAHAGARQLEVTINGIGERAGNASLEEVHELGKVRYYATYPYPLDFDFIFSNILL
ncbi:RHOMBOID-like protein 10, chloroplastic [Zea mays]|uniref:RHOMBOID-like protein 10, chloroplastic n=1 Tax=Zea mays TaxID=4577 RepID=A0A317Y616_MAIZE|nr:RHOMBOID-like protein 10, chloroplastic [Zea mays]